MIDALTQQAHRFLANHLEPGSVCIDATAGNGHDTEFLARQVGPDGVVYAFDIQPEAIAALTARLDASGLSPMVRIVQADHAALDRHIEPPHAGTIRAIVFNLGYLPGGDTSITSLTSTTLAALNASLSLLARCGLLSIMLYPGHPEGRKESDAVQSWAEDLDPTSWTSAAYRLLNRSDSAPSLLLIQKRPPGPGLTVD